MQGVQGHSPRRWQGQDGSPGLGRLGQTPGAGGWRDEDICLLLLPYQLPPAEQQASGWCPWAERPHTDSDRGLCSGQLIVSRPGRPAGLGLSGLDRGPWPAETLPPTPRHSHFLSGAPESPAGFRARGCSQPEHGVTSEVTGRTSRSMLAGNLHVSGAGSATILNKEATAWSFHFILHPRSPRLLETNVHQTFTLTHR